MRYVKGSSFKGELEKYSSLRLSFGFDFPAFLAGESVFPWALEQIEGGTLMFLCSIRHHQMFHLT